ncbi:MAG: hypothetical protein PUE80_00155 [bacterium]|nr:hypothetical protein [bacterium]
MKILSIHKTIKFAGICLSTALMLVGASCGSDEEEKLLDLNTIETVGKQLYSIGGTYFSYDSEGRCTRVSDSYNTASIDWLNHVLRIYDDREYHFKTNVNGFFTEFESEYEDYDDGEHIKIREKMQFSYDKQGHLTKIAYAYTDPYFKQTSNSTFIWKNGNLVKSTHEVAEKEDGYSYNYKTESETSYGTELNLFNQYTYTQTEYDSFSFYLIDKFALVGLLGVGPANFPTNFQFKESNAPNWDIDINITAHELGFIKRESTTRGSYYYNYNTIEAGKNAAAIVGTSKAPTARHRGLMICRHQKKCNHPKKSAYFG